MVNDNGLYHVQKRKRAHDKKLEPYPHPHKFKGFIDHLVYVVGILGPMFGAAQVYKIWSTQNAAGVSLLMFGSHIVFNLVWLIYGIIHKEKPIVLMYSLWFIINILITYRLYHL